LKAGVRRDPFAMLPFCGYNMGDYFGHWIEMGKKATNKDVLPKFFFVNWFRKQDGKWLWPGYGDNSRVLAYIFDRCNGEGSFNETAIGKVPTVDAINIDGLNITKDEVAAALSFSTDEWKAEVALIEEHYANFGSHMPAELVAELNALKSRLGM